MATIGFNEDTTITNGINVNETLDKGGH